MPLHIPNTFSHGWFFLFIYKRFFQNKLYYTLKCVMLSVKEQVKSVKNQDPVVQSIVSLTISLRHKFVKQISAKVTNTLLFFVEKM